MKSHPLTQKSYMRVRHAETRNKATVRFQGEIPVTQKQETTLQQFYGIEYDEPNTGKYDGTYQGVQYFQCPENQGAFVKDKKLIFSTNLHDGILAKYVTDRKAEKIMTLSDGQLTKEIEFVGIEQVDGWHRQIGKMQSIGFPDDNISTINNYEALKELIKSCKSLDLSDNLLTDLESALLLFLHLPSLHDLNISNNFNLAFQSLGQELLDQLKQIEKQNCALLMNNIRLKDNQKLTEKDLNVICQLKFISHFEMNNSQLEISHIQQNVNLVSLSLTQSLHFSKLQELIEFLGKFPNLQEFTACDCLAEEFTTLNDISEVKSSKLMNLNLQESAIQFDSLSLLQQFAPNLQYFKILKVFHSRHSDQKSIFQSDQVIPLIAGLFYSTLKQVNSYEIKQKHLTDYQLFYLKYLCKTLENSKQTLTDDQIEQIISQRINISKELLTEELFEKHKENLRKYDILLELGQTQQNTQQSESQVIQDQYNERLMKIVCEKSFREILITKSTPVWKLIEILKFKFGPNVENKKIYLKFDGNRCVDLYQVRFSSLLEEFREFFCYVEFK